MDGLFVVGLGVMVFVLGLVNAFPLQRLNPKIPKSTGYLRGAEIGGYAGMALGTILILIGLVAAVVQWLT